MKPPFKPAQAARAPKTALEAERAVLGCLLIEAAAARKVLDAMTAESFYLEDHRHVFKAAAAVFARDGAVDIVTLAQAMTAAGTLAGIGGSNAASSGKAYLVHLVESVVHTAHADYYARLVKEAALDRRIEVQLIKTAQDKTPENVKALHELMVALHGVRHERVFDFRVDLGEALDELLKAKAEVVDLGFPKLDAALGGLDVGDITTVGARTSGGKTAFMVKACLQVAARGVECLYLTTEMTEAQVVARVLPAASGVPAWKFRRRVFDKEDPKKMLDACAENLSRLPIKVYGKSRFSLHDINAVVVQAKPRVVFVDYLQRCEFPPGDTRAYQIMDFMISLKTMAQESRLNIIIGCQLDRRLDKTAPEPENADLKDSGAIEAESDQVLLLWKPTEKELLKEGGDPAPPGHHVIRAKISKNRHGAAWDRADFLLNGPLVDLCQRLAPEPAQEDLWTSRADMK